MKEKEEQSVVLKTVYIADDGTKFDSKSECKFYEDNIMILKALNTFKQLDMENPHCIPCDGLENNEEYEYDWYLIKDAKDLETFKSTGLASSECAFKSYPEIICVEKDDYEYPYVHTLSDCISYIKDFCKNFGLQISFKKYEDSDLSNYAEEITTKASYSYILHSVYRKYLQNYLDPNASNKSYKHIDDFEKNEFKDKEYVSSLLNEQEFKEYQELCFTQPISQK